MTTGVCAVEDCGSVAHRVVCVTLGESQDYCAALPLCRWHAFDLDHGTDHGDEYACLECGGPVQPEKEWVEEAGCTMTFWVCTSGCIIRPGYAMGWETGIMYEETRNRLRAAWSAGTI